MGRYKIYITLILISICLNINTFVYASAKGHDISENTNTISENVTEQNITKSNIIYVGSLTTATSTGDGLTPETATRDVERALRIVPDGGIIQLVPNTVTSYIGQVFINKNITFRGTTGDEEIHFRYGINMNANLTIENVELFIGSGVATTDRARGKIFVNGNTLNIGYGVKTIQSTGTGTNYNLAGVIYAGAENKDVAKGKKSVINIRSGNFAKIVMTGGSFNYIDYNIVAQPANMYGDVEINITGGAIGEQGTGGIYAYSDNTTVLGNEYLGNTKVNVRGHDIRIGEISFGANKGRHIVNLNSTGIISANALYNIDELIINGPSVELLNRNAFAGTKSISLMPGSVLTLNLLHYDFIIDGDFYGGGRIVIRDGANTLRFNAGVFNTTTITTQLLDTYIIDTKKDVTGTFVTNVNNREVVKEIINDRARYKVTHKKNDGYDITVYDGIVGGTVTYEIDRTASSVVNWVYVTATPDPGYRLEDVQIYFKDGSKHQVAPSGDGRYLYRYPDKDTIIYAIFERDLSQPAVKPATNLRWDRNQARFDASDEALEYEVILYKNRNTIKTIKTNELFVDFNAEMIKFGTENQNLYQFSVQALAMANSQKVDSDIQYSSEHIAFKPINNIEVRLLGVIPAGKIGINIFKNENDKYIEINSSEDYIQNTDILHGLNNGEYIIQLYSKGFLIHNTAQIILDNEQANKVINIELLAGDNDENSAIDAIDRSFVINNLGRALDDTNRYLDYNGDNNISTLDLGLLLKNMGKTY